MTEREEFQKFLDANGELTRLGVASFAWCAWQMRAEISLLKHAALHHDAERYRWLRQNINGERWHVLFDDCGRDPLDMTALDAAIDAEMARKG